MPTVNLRWGVVCWLLVSFGAIASAQEVTDQPGGGLAFAAAIEQSLQSAIARAEKSVVAIARVRTQRESNDPLLMDIREVPFGQNFSAAPNDPLDSEFVPTEYGTGVVIDRRLILTTCDVLGDLEGFEDQSVKAYVTGIDRKVRRATVEAADPRSNLAVLSVEDGNLTPITFGDGSKLKKGQIVVALGNPYAIARDGEASASWGIVANLQRKAGRTHDETSNSGKTTLHHLGTLIQTDAKLNLGTSGGALLNLKGEMVGLTTSMAAAAGYEQAAGYAIPVDETFRRILEDLRNGREVQYGFLGVQPNLMPEARQAVPQGVLVQDVVHGAPAERFGIQPGDVITKVNGKPIQDFDALVLHVSSHPAGEQVELAVERHGRQVPVKLTLAKFRVPSKALVTRRDPAWRGLRMDYWTAAIDFLRDREQLMNIDEEGCVVVTEVEPDSLAAKAGLKPLMVITHVDGARVSNPREFSAAVRSIEGAVTLTLAPASGVPSELVVAAE